MANYSYQRLSYSPTKIDKLLRNSEVIRQLIGADGFNDIRFTTLVDAINMILAHELTVNVDVDTETAVFAEAGNENMIQGIIPSKDDPINPDV